MTSHAFAWVTGEPSAATDRDLRQDQRVMLVGTGAIGGLFAVATSVQSVLAMGVFSTSLRGVGASPVSEIVLRAAINIATVTLMLVLVALLRPERRPLAQTIAVSAAVVVFSGFVRAGAQLATGVYSGSTAWVAWAEIVTTSVACAVSLVIGFALVGVWRRLRSEERGRVQSRLETALAYRELQEEELRVRREVAQSIHGSVQSVFVMLEAELSDVAQRVASGTTPPADEADRILRAAATVRDLRERELRSLSSVLYPVDFDRGVDPAITALVMRLPAHVAVDAGYHDAALLLDQRAEPLPFGTRLLIVRIAEEALSNALRHGHASAVRIGMQVEPAGAVRLEVDDDGTGVAAGSSWSGLQRLERHLALLEGSLTLGPSTGLGGATLVAVVPLPAAPAPVAPAPLG